MRKILVVTGSRSDYGILKPIIERISNAPGLNTYVLATGTHLLSIAGRTIREIINDGYNVLATGPVMSADLDNYQMALAAGKSVMETVKILKRVKPDILLLLGDRVEVLGAAVAATYMNVPIAHVHGGDRSLGGHIDDSVRHAISKLAHIHFAVTKKSARRLLNLGEEKWRVFNVGSPSIDFINKVSFSSEENNEFLKKYNLSINGKLLIVIYNPITTESEDSAKKIKFILEAVKKTKEQTIVIYPNMDAGSRKIIKYIDKYKDLPFIRCVPNLDHVTFVKLMKAANVMIGNTSSGFIEAPSCKLPFVHVGNRQKGREHTINVINTGYDVNEIYHAIKKALYDKKFREQVKRCKNPYGDGHASERIVKVLSTIKLDKKLLQKQITY